MNKKKLSLTVGAAVLAGAMIIGGTFAYLTDRDDATNTFTVGRVKIELQEPNYPGNDDPETKDIVPNQEIAKDPQVKNTGVNDAIMFLKVTVPVKNVTLVADDGTKGTKENREIFWLKQSDDGLSTHANNFNLDDWVELPSKEEGTDHTGATRTYVFAHKTAVAKDATTNPLFDKVQLVNVVEDEIVAGEAQNIVVDAYAIQASMILEDDVDLGANLTTANLEKIYDAYVTQNPAGSTSDSGSGSGSEGSGSGSEGSGSGSEGSGTGSEGSGSEGSGSGSEGSGTGSDSGNTTGGGTEGSDSGNTGNGGTEGSGTEGSGTDSGNTTGGGTDGGNTTGGGTEGGNTP